MAVECKSVTPASKKCGEGKGARRGQLQRIRSMKRRRVKKTRESWTMFPLQLLLRSGGSRVT